MKHRSSVIIVALSLLMWSPARDVAARGGGRIGGGGRASAARAAASRSTPANYGSLRSAQASRPRSPDTTQYRGETRTFETRRGGEVTAGVSQQGNVAVRGTTAGGREYAGAGRGGDRAVAAKTAQGDVLVRARGDGDGVMEVLPEGTKTIYVEGEPQYPYYYYNHRYYWPYFYGGSVYYQEIYPPYGTSTSELPTDAEIESVGGTDYYVYDDVHYVKEGDHYVVSAPPEESAKTAPAATEPSPVELTKAMCAHVAGYSNFVVESTEQVERPGEGPTTVNRRILVSRPGRIAAAGSGGSVVTRFWYDGKTVTTFDEQKGVYSSVAAPATIEATLGMLEKDYGLTLPLADLISADLCDTLAPVLGTMKYEGEETVSGKRCHKLGLVTQDFYAQLWIDADENAPLPRKVDVLYMTPGSEPRYVGVITKWEAQKDIDPNLFVFQPPADARRIEMLKRVD